MELPVKQIVDRLQKLPTRVTPEDVTNPQAQRMQIIYGTFLVDILKFALDVEFIPLHGEYDKERHPKTMQLCRMLHGMTAFLRDFFGHDPSLTFTMCDLINPVPSRTKRILSALAVFMDFHELETPIFEAVYAEEEKKRKDLIQIQVEIDHHEDMRQELLDKKEARKRRENGILCELEQQKRQLSQEINEIHTTEQHLTDMVAKLEESREGIKKLEIKYERQEKEAIRLSESILKNPDAFLQELNEKRKRLQSLKTAYETIKSELTKTKEKDELCHRTEQELAIISSGIANLANEENKLDESQERLKQELRELSSTKTVLQNYEDTISAKEKSTEENEKKFEKSKKEHVERVSHLKSLVGQLAVELQTLRGATKVIPVEFTELQKAIKLLNMEKKEMIQDARSLMSRKTQRMKEIVQNHAKKRQEFEEKMEEATCFLEEMKTARLE